MESDIRDGDRNTGSSIEPPSRGRVEIGTHGGSDVDQSLRSATSDDADTYHQQARDYAASLARVADLIELTDHTLLSRPTPCSDWNVRMLVAHLIGTAVAVPADACAAYRHRCAGNHAGDQRRHLQPGGLGVPAVTTTVV
ncbi:MAG: maleylpyruvate isomerase N-terminal domain-containing protein [Streptosporangiales bacterium]|nr:maleylpyruvate isomerase N-terminal domain-containing protein [Streptosporangiales bacterium]